MALARVVTLLLLAGLVPHPASAKPPPAHGDWVVVVMTAQRGGATNPRVHFSLPFEHEPPAVMFGVSSPKGSAIQAETGSQLTWGNPALRVTTCTRPLGRGTSVNLCVEHEPAEDGWGTLEFSAFMHATVPAGVSLALVLAMPGTSFPLVSPVASSNLSVDVSLGTGARAINGVRVAADSEVADEVFAEGLVGGYSVWSTGCLACVRVYESPVSHGAEGRVERFPFSCNPNPYTLGFSGPAGAWRFITAGAGDVGGGTPFLAVTAPVGDTWKLFARLADPRPMRPCQGVVGQVSIGDGEPFPPE